MSATTSGNTKRLDAEHWANWLTAPVDMHTALARVAAELLPVSQKSCLIETGAHPVLLSIAVATLDDLRVQTVASAESMRRGQSGRFWTLQRAQLQMALAAATSSGPCMRRRLGVQEGCEMVARLVLQAVGVAVDYDVPLMQLGLKSAYAPALARELSTQMREVVPPTIVFEHGSVRQLARALFAPPGSQGQEEARLIEDKEVGRQLTAPSSTYSTIAGTVQSFAPPSSQGGHPTSMAGRSSDGGPAISASLRSYAVRLAGVSRAQDWFAVIGMSKD